MASKKRDLSEIFPNAPVTEVAFEIRFPQDLKILLQLYKFHDLIKEQFPQIRKTSEVSATPTGIGVTGDLWEFVEPDGGMILRVRADRLGLISTQHKTFEDFRPRIREFTKTFTEKFSITEARRIGLRYSNAIQLGSDFREPMSKFFVPTINPDLFRIEDAFQQLVSVRQREGDYFMTLRTALDKDADESYQYTIDMDAYYQDEAVPIREALKMTEDLHSMIIETFHANVTEAYLETIREK